MTTDILNPVWILAGDNSKHKMRFVSILFFHRTWPLGNWQFCFISWNFQVQYSARRPPTLIADIRVLHQCRIITQMYHDLGHLQPGLLMC